jgi:hypothetical protein
MDPLTEAVLQLWNECLTIDTIAEKLGIDPDIVADIVEAPANYALQLADF